MDVKANPPKVSPNLIHLDVTETALLKKAAQASSQGKGPQAAAAFVQEAMDKITSDKQNRGYSYADVKATMSHALQDKAASNPLDAKEAKKLVEGVVDEFLASRQDVAKGQKADDETLVGDVAKEAAAQAAAKMRTPIA
jgi:Asp-tRNA(Asn)/Glu-tRNA(Gln) amidotransferase B subunit